MTPESPTDSVRLMVSSDGNILSARTHVRAAALRLGFPTTETVRIVTAASELARNILLYAGRGELSLRVIKENGREGILITARDEGPGIPDVNKALLDGFSTSGGLGLGLPGARRLMDEFEIRSEAGRGTIVEARKWLSDGPCHINEQRADESRIETGVAARTLSGQTISGDRFVIRGDEDRVFFAVMDGLGHGPEAAKAAEIAAGVLNSSSTTDIVGLVEECHEKLRRSRGVVMTVACINTADGRGGWVGIGNVLGMLVRFKSSHGGTGRSFSVLRAGVVGQQLPTLKPSSLTVGTGDTFVLATDGVAIDFAREVSLDQSPQQVADRILSKYGLASDDALVLVVRYLGAGT